MDAVKTTVASGTGSDQNILLLILAVNTIAMLLFGAYLIYTTGAVSGNSSRAGEL